MVAVLASIGIFASVGVNLSQDPIQVQSRKLFQQIRCPVCEGQTIADSDAGPSPQLRSEVVRMLEEGKSPDEIKEHFKSMYGAWIVAEPPSRGFASVSWWLPVTFLFVGILILWYFLRRATGRGISPAAVHSQFEPDDLPPSESETQVNDELQQQLRRYL